MVTHDGEYVIELNKQNFNKTKILINHIAVIFTAPLYVRKNVAAYVKIFKEKKSKLIVIIKGSILSHLFIYIRSSHLSLLIILLKGTISCVSQVGETTSLLLAKATDDVKLTVSVLLTSNPLRNLYETQIFGPFRRFRRFQLPRNQTIKAYYFHQYNCSGYENCGCESIPDQDRVDVTRRYKVYTNKFGQTK